MLSYSQELAIPKEASWVDQLDTVSLLLSEMDNSVIGEDSTDESVGLTEEDEDLSPPHRLQSPLRQEVKAPVPTGLLS